MVQEPRFHFGNVVHSSSEREVRWRRGRHDAAWAITGDVVCPRGGNAEATQRGIACARKGKVLVDDAEVPQLI